MLYSQHMTLLLLVLSRDEKCHVLNYLLDGVTMIFVDVKKTKDVAIDWISSLPLPQLTYIKCQMVERVCSYKYLEITIDKMRFDVHAEAECMKRQQRLNSLQRFSTCNISRTLMLLNI